MARQKTSTTTTTRQEEMSVVVSMSSKMRHSVLQTKQSVIQTFKSLPQQVPSSLRRLRLSSTDSAAIDAAAAASSDLIQQEERLSPKIALGLGHFHGAEWILRSEYEKLYPGVLKQTTVGYISPYPSGDGVLDHPTYEQVCEGSSGHVMVVLVEFHQSPTRELFTELIRLYFACHDPTTKFRQDQHRGFQYSSWVFCDGKLQAEIVQAIRDELQEIVDSGALDQLLLLHKQQQHQQRLSSSSSLSSCISYSSSFSPTSISASTSSENNNNSCIYRNTHICTNISQLEHEFTVAEEQHQQYVWNHHAPDDDATCRHRRRFQEWPTKCSRSFDEWEEDDDDDDEEEDNDDMQCDASIKKRGASEGDVLMTSAMLQDDTDCGVVSVGSNTSQPSNEEIIKRLRSSRQRSEWIRDIIRTSLVSC